MICGDGIGLKVELEGMGLVEMEQVKGELRYRRQEVELKRMDEHDK